MRALSIQQPWAWAILYLGKDVENRTWPTEFRGPLLIHASKKYDKAGHDRIKQLLCPSAEIPDVLPAGGIVGKVIVQDCVRSYRSAWFDGPFGFVMRGAQPLHRLVAPQDLFPWPGKLGLFDFPNELLGQLNFIEPLR